MNHENQEQNEKKHNYFYKITNLINGKYYYGIHSTNNLEDEYMGSGNLIKAAIKKYGKENFKKEIIADYLTSNEVINHEKIVVTQELVDADECYNLKCGGIGLLGFRHSNETKEKISQGHIGFKHSELTKMIISEKNTGKTVGELNGMFNKNFTEEELDVRRFAQQNKRKSSEETKQKQRLAHLGKKFSEETKQKMRLSSSKKLPVIINGIIYESLAAAGRELKMCGISIKTRINSNFEQWSEWKFYES